MRGGGKTHGYDVRSHPSFHVRPGLRVPLFVRHFDRTFRDGQPLVSASHIFCISIERNRRGAPSINMKAAVSNADTYGFLARAITALFVGTNTVHPSPPSFSNSSLIFVS